MSLTDHLTQTEGKNGVFESKMREKKIPLNPFFGTKSNPIIPQFNPIKATQSIPTSIGSFLPKLADQTFIKHLLISNQSLKIQKSKRIAVLFSGGPAPGGHNVIIGLLHSLLPQHTVLGVLNGPSGLLSGKLNPLKLNEAMQYFNCGGFDYLGTSRTKLSTKSQLNQVKECVKTHQLDGIVIIGGDDSNTNAAILANELIPLNCSVIGVPKTIDGDLIYKDQLAIPFGFDTATKVYSELTGNLMKDAQSVKKYWHFVKLMGRDTSHVTLEVALQTKPTLTLITEEIIKNNFALSDIVNQVVDVIVTRYKQGIQHGVIILPEGLITHIAEEIITVTTPYQTDPLLSKRDEHGHHQLSAIPTEILLGRCIQNELKNSSISFEPRYHSFGYEGRCSVPSYFDAWYGYHLGLTAGALILANHTGYMASLMDLANGGTPIGIPLLQLFNTNSKNDQGDYVIQRAPVNLNSPAFNYFKSRRQQWKLNDCFTSHSPIQWSETNTIEFPISVALNQGYDTLKFY